jgi:hypothetical protein
MAEYSEETAAILDRLKKEGSYIRNAKSNSLKQVNINLTKFHDSFKSLSGFLQDNARAQSAAAAEAAKVNQEAAEKSRRKEELSEVIDPRQAKLDDLRMKASLLRAKSDLKQAKGPGLLTKMNDNKMNTAKIVAAVLGAGFLLKPIMVGVLDDARPKWREELGEGMDALKNLKDFNLDTTIEDATTKMAQKMDAAFKETISNIKFEDMLGPLGKGLLSLVSIATVASFTKSIIQSGAIIGASGGLSKYMSKLNLFGTAKADVSSMGQAVKNKVSMNPVKPLPMQPQLQGMPEKPTVVQKLLDKAKITSSSSKLNITGKLLGPAAAAITVYDAVRDRDIEANAAAENIAELLENDRSGFGSIAAAAGAGAITGGLLGSAGGPAAAVTAGIGAVANGSFQGLSVLYQYVNDAVNDLDQLPNDIEDLVRKEQKILENKKLTPQERKDQLKQNAVDLAAAREKAFNTVSDMESEIAQLSADLDSGNFAVTNMFGGKMGDKRLTEAEIRKKLEKGRDELLLRQNQLINTDRARELMQGTRNAEILKLDALIEASILKVSKTMGPEAGAMVDGSTQVATTIVNNNTKNVVTHKYETTHNSGAISVLGGTGSEGDGQFVMG